MAGQLCPADHYHLPDIVVPTQDHPGFGEAGGADLAKLCLAAGALEAAGVPVPLHGQQQEPVLDAGAAPGARLGHSRLVDGDRAVGHPGDAWAHHLRAGGELEYPVAGVLEVDVVWGLRGGGGAGLEGREGGQKHVTGWSSLGSYTSVSQF